MNKVIDEERFLSDLNIVKEWAESADVPDDHWSVLNCVNTENQHFFDNGVSLKWTEQTVDPLIYTLL